MVQRGETDIKNRQPILKLSIFNVYLVEAAGIEPASASTPLKGLHAYLALLI